jgi:hypothetical protein
MSTPVPYSVVEAFLEGIGLTEEDMPQKIEITAGGILVTCGFTVEGRPFTKTLPNGDGESLLLYYRAFEIEREHVEDHEHDENGNHLEPVEDVEDEVV